MKQILDTIFYDIIEDYKIIYIGNSLIFALDDDRRIEVTFYAMRSGTYEGLRLRLVHKRSGEIDCKIIMLRDIFEHDTDSNELHKHIWYNGGWYSWYGYPTRQDIEDLRQTLSDYIEIWR